VSVCSGAQYGGGVWGDEGEHEVCKAVKA
jgi:hypothetical protein